MGRSYPFLFSLGRYSKQAGDEGSLPSHISFVHPVHLSLANHVHRFIVLERSSCRFYGKEAQPRFDQPFDEAVVLLNQVIQVFDWSQFNLLRKYPSGFELGISFRIGRMLIDSDHPRSRCRGVGVSQSRELFHLLLNRTPSRS